MMVSLHVVNAILDLARNEVRAHFEFPAFLGPHAFPHVDKQPHPTGRDNHGRQQYRKKEQSYFSNLSHILYHIASVGDCRPRRKTAPHEIARGWLERVRDDVT